jgi:hypothetical protein
MQLRLYRSWTDVLNTNVGVAKLFTQTHDESVQGGFGRRVSRQSKDRNQADRCASEYERAWCGSRKKVGKGGVDNGHERSEVDGHLALEDREVDSVGAGEVGAGLCSSVEEDAVDRWVCFESPSGY